MPDATGDWKTDVRERLAGLGLAPTREAEIVDELSQHLADREAEVTRGGASAGEARRIVLDELDGHELIRRALDETGQTHAAGPAVWAAPAGTWRPQQLWQDARYAMRSLAKDRGYTLAAVLALAVGIGATAAIFGAVDAVLIRPMPFPHADRLVVPVSVNVARQTDQGSTTFADYMDWRGQIDIFEAVALWRPINIDITGGGDPERVEAEQVAEEFFRVIDVKPIAGRTFVPADHVVGAPQVVLLSHGLWQRRFGAADVVGTKITVSGTPVEIIGVLPPHAVWPDTGDLYLPLRPFAFNDDVRTRRDNMIFQTLARLKDTASIEQGNARLKEMAARLEREQPVIRKGWTNALIPLRNYIVETDVRSTLVALLGAVGAVLLVVCANVASLALVRGQSRSRELAIRLTLGASRTRIVQQLVVESTMLAVAGAALGCAVAYWSMRGLVLMAPSGTPFVDQIGFDSRVLWATATISTTALLLFGLVPALASSSVRLGGALKDRTPGAGSSRHVMRLRHLLVVGEVAAAVVLLVAASLFVRSLGRLTHVDAGVDIDRVVTGRLSLPSARYTNLKRSQFYADLVNALEARPDVESAAAASFIPAGTGGFGLGRVFVAEGHPEPPAAPDTPAQWNSITPGYFRTVGIRVIAGRAFTDQDRADTTPVIIVTQDFAQRAFPGESPLGKRVRSWRDENVLREIVGVVSSVKYEGLSDRDYPVIYVPYAQDGWTSMLVAVRAKTGDPAPLGIVLRDAVKAIDPLVAVARVTTMASAAQASIATQRYGTLLLGLLAATALALAGLGVYSVMNYVFLLRRREMGIRVALGASSSSIYTLVFRYGLILTAVGLVIGSAGAVAASRALGSLLFNTSAADAVAWTSMIGVIFVAACLACIWPARQSAKADAMEALRAE